MIDFGYGMSAIAILAGFVGCSFGVDWVAHVYDRHEPAGTIRLRRMKSER